MPAVHPDRSDEGLAPPDPRPNWYLTGRLAGEMEVQSFAISPFPFRVGRRPGLSLTLPRHTVSGLHAEFDTRGTQLLVRDLGSTNGTFVNGNRLRGEAIVRENDVVQLADAPFRIGQQVSELPSSTYCKNACDHALALVQFDHLLSGEPLVPAYQPIVNIQTRQVMAYEALARSRVVGLETPDVMFNAAAEFDSTAELSRLLRQIAVDCSSSFEQLPHLFLNTHPVELTSEDLIESCRQLRRLSPRQKITIEIHEAVVTSTSQMVALRRALEAIDMTLAFDDFGSGQARIAELAEVRPEYIKFDRSIVKNLDLADGSRLRLMHNLVSMVCELGITPLAEGIETPGEHSACIDAGFQLAQGYLYGRPQNVSHYRRTNDTRLNQSTSQLPAF